MAELNCQFVRPDRLLYEGPVASLILVTHSGELGVWPGHASEICSLGDGIVRLRELPEKGGAEKSVIISGGYAEINPEGVIILADHARDIDDIDPDTVRRTRQKAFDLRDELDEDDHRRAYYDNKIKWCNLLLQHSGEQGGTQ